MVGLLLVKWKLGSLLKKGMQRLRGYDQKPVDQAIIRTDNMGWKEYYNSPPKVAVNIITFTSEYSMVSMKVKHKHTKRRNTT